MSHLDTKGHKANDFYIKRSIRRRVESAVKDEPTDKVKEYFRRKPYEPCKKANADGEEKGNDNN